MEEKLSLNKLFELFINEAQSVPLSPEKVIFWEALFEGYFKNSSILVYTDLTEAIYSGTENDLEIIRDNWTKIMERSNQKELVEPDISEKFKKVEDHIKLAITQRRFILNNVEQLMKEIDVAQSTVESLKDIKTRIYTEFVAILGIFTAVVLGAFGSLQVIGSVFSNIKDVPTGKLLVFSSLTSIGVLVLLFLLMRWINRIVYKDNKQISWEFSINENLTFVIGLVVLFYMFVIGFLLYTNEPKEIIFNWFSNEIIGIIIFAGFTIITIVILVKCFSLINKNVSKHDK